MARDVGNLKLRLMSFNCGDLKDPQEVLELFADLIYSTKAWTSGQMVADIAQGMLNNNQITQDGDIIKHEGIENGKAVNQESDK